MSGTSPVARQRELGTRLRALRNERGMTVEEVAAELLCSTTKISRLETAARRPSLRDVRDLCVLYELDQQMSRELMSLAREARESGWWTTVRGPWPRPAHRAGTRSHQHYLLLDVLHARAAADGRVCRTYYQNGRAENGSACRPAASRGRECAARKCWATTGQFIAYYLTRWYSVAA